MKFLERNRARHAQAVERHGRNLRSRLVPSIFSSVQLIDAAFIVAEAAQLDRTESESLVKAVSPGVVGERINQHSGHSLIGETTGTRELHHGCPIALT